MVKKYCDLALKDLDLEKNLILILNPYQYGMNFMKKYCDVAIYLCEIWISRKYLS